jgi:hypothetical protein
MSKVGPPAEYTDELSSSDLPSAELTDDPDIEYMPSVRTLLIQTMVIFTATLLCVLRKQNTAVFGYSLDNWALMPLECALYTGLTLFLGAPILMRDFTTIRKLAGWGV